MKMLILLDGSKFAEAILDPASKLAARSGGNFEAHLAKIASVIADVGQAALDPGLTPVGAVRVSGNATAAPEYPSPERVYHDAERYLGDIAERFFSRAAKKRVIFGEYPAAEIVSYARRENVDMIAITTNGKTGLARMLLFNGVAPLFLVHPSVPLKGCCGLDSRSGVKAQDLSICREVAA